MSQLTIELSPTLSQQIEESGLGPQQVSEIVTRFIRLYLHQHQTIQKIQTADMVQSIDSAPRKAGSGKHLNITMSDDFDEPLEDFAEYM